MFVRNFRSLLYCSIKCPSALYLYYKKRIMIEYIKPTQWKTIRWQSFSVRQAFITCDIDSRRRRRVQSKYIILYMQMIPIPLQPNSLPGHAFWVIKGRISRRQRNKIYSYDIIWSFFFHFQTRFTYPNPFYYSSKRHETILTWRTLQIMPLSMQKKVFMSWKKVIIQVLLR